MSEKTEKILQTPPLGEVSDTNIEKGGTSDPHLHTGFDEKATKAIIRKVDLHIVPVLVILYLLGFSDRTNIGNARLAGLEEDLGMNEEGLEYNVRNEHTSGSRSVTRLMIKVRLRWPSFNPFYVAAVIPSNIMMKITRPFLWLPSIMVAWGTCENPFANMQWV